MVATTDLTSQFPERSVVSDRGLSRSRVSLYLRASPGTGPLLVSDHEVHVRRPDPFLVQELHRAGKDKTVSMFVEELGLEVVE